MFEPIIWINDGPVFYGNERYFHFSVDLTLASTVLSPPCGNVLSTRLSLCCHRHHSHILVALVTKLLTLTCRIWVNLWYNFIIVHTAKHIWLSLTQDMFINHCLDKTIYINFFSSMDDCHNCFHFGLQYFKIVKSPCSKSKPHSLTCLGLSGNIQPGLG